MAHPTDADCGDRGSPNPNPKILFLCNDELMNWVTLDLSNATCIQVATFISIK